MNTFDDYHKAFTTESEEEVRIGKEIDEENERFEELAETKAHYEKVKELLTKRSELFQERLEKAREIRRSARRKIIPSHTPEKSEKPARSKELEEAMKAVGKLDYKDKLILSREFFSEKIPNGKKMMDKDTLTELHDILVQTVLDFINEKGLKDIWSVAFSADSLQESADFGTWCPATDSFLSVESIEEQVYTDSDGKEHTIEGRVNIGESF